MVRAPPSRYAPMNECLGEQRVVTREGTITIAYLYKKSNHLFHDGHAPGVSKDPGPALVSLPFLLSVIPTEYCATMDL